jgi:retinol dehydrogenase-14
MEQSRGGPMADRTVLVTGGSGGIGRATALGLAAIGAHLAITGRDRGRTEDAAREIRAAGGGPVDVFVADLSSQQQVRRLAGEVHQRLPRIDVLVNNAGGFWNTRHVTADGLERTFALNHLAPFLLTSLLLDQLKHSAPARVVTVSSNVQAIGRIDFDDLQGEQSYSGARAYSQSKLANVLFTYELARRLQGTAVTANALHPGVVRTAFGAEDPRGVQRLFTPFMRPFMKIPAQGAATSIHLASAPDLEQVTGRYFASSKPRRSSKRSYDQAAAARLWQVSADLAGLTAAGVTTSPASGKADLAAGLVPRRHRADPRRGPLRARAAALGTHPAIWADPRGRGAPRPRGASPERRGERVKFSGGNRTVISVPFAEPKELIAGYWILQVTSMDEAVDSARHAPFEALAPIYPGGYGTEGEIEIRQLFELKRSDASN